MAPSALNEGEGGKRKRFAPRLMDADQIRYRLELLDDMGRCLQVGKHSRSGLDGMLRSCLT